MTSLSALCRRAPGGFAPALQQRVTVGEWALSLGSVVEAQTSINPAGQAGTHSGLKLDAWTEHRLSTPRGRGPTPSPRCDLASAATVSRSSSAIVHWALRSPSNRRSPLPRPRLRRPSTLASPVEMCSSSPNIQYLTCRTAWAPRCGAKKLHARSTTRGLPKTRRSAAACRRLVTLPLQLVSSDPRRSSRTLSHRQLRYSRRALRSVEDDRGRHVRAEIRVTETEIRSRALIKRAPVTRRVVEPSLVQLYPRAVAIAPKSRHAVTRGASRGRGGPRHGPLRPMKSTLLHGALFIVSSRRAPIGDILYQR